MDVADHGQRRGEVENVGLAGENGLCGGEEGENGVEGETALGKEVLTEQIETDRREIARIGQETAQ